MTRTKGQITIFILLGVVLLIILLFIIYMVNRTEGTTHRFTFESKTIQSYVTSCLNDISGDGLVLLGKQGGYIEPENYLITPNYRVSYLVAENQNLVPYRETMEAELARYVNQHLNDCLQGLKVFEDQGWRVLAGAPHTRVQINRLTVSIDLEFSLTVISEEKSISLDRFVTEHQVRLLHIRDSADRIVDSLIAHNNLVDLTMLSAFDLSFAVFPYKEKIIIDVEDKQSLIKQGQFHFTFAVS